MTFEDLPKILIVNDDPSTLLALASLLEDSSEAFRYEVFTVLSGEEALRKVLKHNFAVVLLDVSMPTMDGFETADALRSHPRSSSVPIIFVTAYYGDEFTRLKAYGKGAADYLFAPLIPEIVRSKVAVFVDLYQKNLELQHRSMTLEARNGALLAESEREATKLNMALQEEIKARAAVEEKAKEIQSFDVLTGALNRHAFLQALRSSILAQPRGSATEVLIVKIQKLGDFNMLYGHLFGDEVLLHLARTLTSLMTRNQRMGRLGSDEFAVVFESEVPGSHLIDFIQHVAQLYEEPIDIGGKNVKMSLLVGASFQHNSHSDVDSMLRAAYLIMATPINLQSQLRASSNRSERSATC